MNRLLSADSKIIKGSVTLDGSKSISNRVLIIRALCTDQFTIRGLSTSDDSVTLQALLNANDHFDAHHAGTTFRFMTAFLAIKGGTKTLTGSERMKERPIGPLVDALRQIGAQINYLEKEGYPPLKIMHFDLDSYKNELSIAGDISSQYLSALALIAPVLPEGLTINIEGELVSKPYLQMTLSIMEHFGVNHEWQENKIVIAPQKYQANNFNVEADWSAASYYYSLAAMSDEAEIELKGLSQNSLQGDAVIADIGSKLGLLSEWNGDNLTIKKTKELVFPKFFDFDFESCPDIAQTVAVICAANNIQATFTGLKTLRIKETDRIAALQNELQKFGVFLSKLPSQFSSKSNKEYYMINGTFQSEEIQSIPTYKDHRMAMSFAPLALKNDIIIEEAKVVSKSYPKFWEDMEVLGVVAK